MPLSRQKKEKLPNTNRDHSHKKQKGSLETWEKTMGIIFKNRTCSDENELLGGDFHPVLHKVEADILQVIKK